jgi:hypothetical protein
MDATAVALLAAGEAERSALQNAYRAALGDADQAWQQVAQLQKDLQKANDRSPYIDDHEHVAARDAESSVVSSGPPVLASTTFVSNRASQRNSPSPDPHMTSPMNRRHSDSRSVGGDRQSVASHHRDSRSVTSAAPVVTRVRYQELWKYVPKQKTFGVPNVDANNQSEMEALLRDNQRLTRNVAELNRRMKRGESDFNDQVREFNKRLMTKDDEIRLLKNELERFRTA